MKKSKKPRDTNALAAEIVRQATDPADQGEDPYEGKNPAAVDLGRLGGKKGGRARADKLAPKRRSEIARNAATERWSRQT